MERVPGQNEGKKGRESLSNLFTNVVEVQESRVSEEHYVSDRRM